MGFDPAEMPCVDEATGKYVFPGYVELQWPILCLGLASSLSLGVLDPYSVRSRVSMVEPGVQHCGISRSGNHQMSYEV